MPASALSLEDGIGCKRRVCFFAHTESELRKPADDPAWLEQQLQSELAAGDWLTVGTEGSGMYSLHVGAGIGWVAAAGICSYVGTGLSGSMGQMSRIP